jgi:hypothetical protein
MQIITNNKGEKIVDPHHSKERHEKWLDSIGYPHNIDYFAFEGVSNGASELITRYVLDLFMGKNLARGTRRGQRSYIHLCNARVRLRKSISLIEKYTKKTLLELEEDDILRFFNDMRNGTIKKDNGKPYLDVGSHSKKFVAFLYLVRT